MPIVTEWQDYIEAMTRPPTCRFVPSIREVAEHAVTVSSAGITISGLSTSSLTYWL